MARINSKQAKEMNEAYAKIYQNFQERFDPSKYDLSKPQGGLSNKEYAALSNSEIRGLERASSDYLRKNPDAYTTIKTKDGKTLKKGDDGFEQELSKARDTLRTANDKSLGRGSSNNNQSNNNNNQTTQQKPVAQQQQQQKPATQQQQQQKPVAQQQQQQRPATGGQPQGGTPVNKLFGRGGSDGSPAPYTGGPNAAQRANAGTQKPVAQGGGAQQQPVKTVGGQGNRQRPVKTGGIQAGKAIRGGLSRLGSLAGKAVSAGRVAAGKLKQVATSAAKGVQSAASGVKRVAGGVADAATGNLTDLDKRGGKPTGMARVVAGGIDKVTGDRTDLDKRGVTPLNAGQRAQQQQKQAPQAQAKPATQQQRPVSRLSGLSSGAQQAQQMAKKRIAAGRNTVTGALKSAKPIPKVTSVMDMEGYDPMENLFDDTVKFLVSEGHAKDASEAMSIMSESEFIDAFKEELNG